MPPYLKKGDTIAIISPSGVVEATYVYAAKNVLESWGYQVAIGKHCLAVNGRFAGTEEQRLSDIIWAIESKEIKAILCSRGGYGLIRLLPELFQLHFSFSPKLIIGYSDITVLHNVLSHQHICSLHAPMARHLSDNSSDTASLMLKQILQGELPTINIDSDSLNKMG